MIQPARLAGQLREGGFRLAWRDRADECGFVRPADAGELYEQLIVKAAGRRGEAVFAHAAVSIVTGPMATKGMVEMVLLDEFATDRDRGWAVIDKHEDAIGWERRLADVGPTRAREVTLQKGTELLNRTDLARGVARSVLERLPAADHLDTLRSLLLPRTTESIRAEAERLARWPGVMRLVGGEELYQVATLALVALAPGGAAPVGGADPITDPEVMWEIQLLVDRLMSQCGLDIDALRSSKGT